MCTYKVLDKLSRQRLLQIFDYILYIRDILVVTVVREPVYQNTFIYVIETRIETLIFEGLLLEVDICIHIGINHLHKKFYNGYIQYLTPFLLL